MENLLKRQKELGDLAALEEQKILSGKIRKASCLEYTEHIQTIMKEFTANHNKIMANKTQEAEDYIAKNYYEHVIQIMENSIRNLKVQNVAEGPSAVSSKWLIGSLQQANQFEQTDAVSNVEKRYQRRAKKLKNTFDEIEQNELDSLEQMREYKTKLQIQFENVEEAYLETQNIQLKEITEDSIEDQIEKFREKYKINLEKLTEKLKSNNTTQKMYSNIKLQEIKIPIFYGEMKQWSSFRDLFKSLVHNSEHFTEVEKMFRLKTSLGGEAGRLIQHLPVIDKNYEAAWQILQDRYENRRLQFTAQVDRLLDQPSANGESAASMKQLLDTTKECIYALKGLDLNLDNEQAIIARIVVRKLDKESLRLYEQNVKKSREIQSLDDVFCFLEQQYQALEAIRDRKTAKWNNQKQPQRTPTFYTAAKKNCVYCKVPGHQIFECRKFQALTTMNRRKFITSNKLCYICLDHVYEGNCSNKKKCNKCERNHHNLLHYNEFQKGNEENITKKSSTMMTKHSETAILLATAQIRVKAADGEYVTLRALIDQGSQKTTISEEAAQILHLPKIREVTELQGLGNTTVGVSKFKICIEIKPRFLSNEAYNVEALVLPKLASAQPDKSFKWDVEQWKNYTLADPSFNKSDRIDVVIGSDIYADILEEGIFKKDRILGQATKLGWILSGVLQQPRKNNKILAAVTTTLEKFWEIEDTTTPADEADDDECLKIFEKTTVKDENNRFVVNLPFKKEKELGDSRKQAMARFLNLEKRFATNDELRKQYVQFMREYLELGHMKKANENRCGKYYLPHQAVIREGSLTTKLRVVFDASAKTTNGSSLNDILFIGPRLQKDIFDIIIKWRLWQYVLTSDIEKMFRQIKITESDQDYQRILWRETKGKPIEEYKLQTVTYGTASAPFLATRTLQEIANFCEPHNYLLSNIIKNDFYMDDLMTGADSINECKAIQYEISKQLQKYGFHLRKWMSNNSEIIATIPINGANEVIKIAEDETIKTLGIQWDPTKDMFGFNTNLSTKKLVTKRQALSDLARIFDPMGWLSPITVIAKLFIQKLWLMKLNWDELLDENLTKEWQEFMQHIPEIKRIKIPRWFETKNNFKFELHGFADASEKAYAAVVYAKVGSVITIVAGKTKVNPIKNKKTLPKLELCAAHLLAKLLQRIKTVINREVQIFAWSDSSITLAWINNCRSKDRFIRTRVEEIKLLTPTAIWQHVVSKDNPADVASRGVLANKLIDHDLWWKGPKWLREEEHQWQTQKIIQIDAMYVTTSKELHFLDKVILKYSSLSKLIRVVAYILRFIKRIRGQKCPEYLVKSEMKEAEEMLIRYQQKLQFREEIMSLEFKKEINNKSSITCLNPILDSNGILRVGGRLGNAHLKYNQKHP